ncbi:Protein transport Sec1a [Stylosanthes scabra]|uniref:Protein transport Sec1a n=1 Tax=Stylosanthes scabra TaxID=79078 RepID=A0ABU6YFL7_9FABA|nr:Protein transport Sec1a [Stylosanthes scabra]
MSLSDSETSNSNTNEYKPFKQVSHDRLLYEMLRSAKSGDSKAWKVLIMDKVTVKVMSHSCKMADITDQDVSLVEDLFRRRQPLPSMDAVYFIQPTKEKAYVFFSHPIPKELVNHIKCDTSVLPRIGALREMNLEYFPIDSQAFITDQETVLQELYGKLENDRKFNACLTSMATRLATVFASMKEFPYVRYRSVKATDDYTPTKRDLVPTFLANAVYELITKYKTTIPNYPQSETCDLIIVDRSIDQIAPVIHEWTYDAMCHDLLTLDGSKYVQEVPSKSGGPPERKEFILDESDSVWAELRNTHIADASERLHDKFTNFVQKNKAAQLHGSFSFPLFSFFTEFECSSLPSCSSHSCSLSVVFLPKSPTDFESSPCYDSNGSTLESIRSQTRLHAPPEEAVFITFIPFLQIVQGPSDSVTSTHEIVPRLRSESNHISVQQPSDLLSSTAGIIPLHVISEPSDPSPSTAQIHHLRGTDPRLLPTRNPTRPINPVWLLAK